MNFDRPTTDHRDWNTAAWNLAPSFPATTDRQGRIYSGSVFVGQLYVDHGRWSVSLRDPDLPVVTGFHTEDDAVEWAALWLHNERRELTGGTKA